MRGSDLRIDRGYRQWNLITPSTLRERCLRIYLKQVSTQPLATGLHAMVLLGLRILDARACQAILLTVDGVSRIL